MSDSKYDYKRFGCNAKRVGQAVVDILSKDNWGIIRAGEITEAQADKYRKSLEEAIETGKKLYQSPFYVLVITNKEFWAENVVRNWFVPRQTPPFATTMYQFYPNHMKTLYMTDPERGHFQICWSLPGTEEILSIARNPSHYHPSLIKWIDEFAQGKLNKEKYDFDYDPINSF